MESHNLSPMSDNIEPSYSQFDWNNFAAHGFDNATAPPTPEDFLPIQHPNPSFEAEESIPYHPLESPDPAGEQLIGMGLYDTPEKSALSDPQLDSYRAAMMTQMLGSAYRKYESTGKGLKLEETWNPPPSDDEGDDDGEGEDDDDAEGSTTNENLDETSNFTASIADAALHSSHGSADRENLLSNAMQPVYNSSGWL